MHVVGESPAGPGRPLRVRNTDEQGEGRGATMASSG